MASENIGSLYPTKMPGYDDAADIQAALRLYHYGSETYDPNNTNESQIPASSIAGHFKALDTRVDSIEATGVGSDYTPTAPSNPVDGFIWVDSDSSPTSFAGKQWVLHDSGNLSGTFFETTNLDGETHKIIFKDYEISNYFDLEVSVNNILTLGSIGQAYADPINTPSDQFISIELANTNASLKPIYGGGIIAFGVFRSSDPVESFKYTLVDVDGNLTPPEFSAGTYEVWSYR